MDPFLLGGLLSFGGGLLSSFLGQNQATTNLKFEQQVFEYQKQLQQQIFGREDTAVQRRVADLRAAGLSPTLAAGGAANSGALVNVKAPQKRAEYDFGFIGQALQQMASIAQTKAQTKLLYAQANKAEQEAKYTSSLKDQSLINATLKNQLLKDTYSSLKWKAIYETNKLSNEVFASRFKNDVLENEAQWAELERAYIHDNPDFAQEIIKSKLNREQIETFIRAVTYKTLESKEIGIENDADLYERLGVGPETIKIIDRLIRSIPGFISGIR